MKTSKATESSFMFQSQNAAASLDQVGRVNGGGNRSRGGDFKQESELQSIARLQCGVWCIFEKWALERKICICICCPSLWNFECFLLWACCNSSILRDAFGEAPVFRETFSMPPLLLLSQDIRVMLACLSSSPLAKFQEARTKRILSRRSKVENTHAKCKTAHLRFLSTEDIRSIRHSAMGT